MSPLTGPIFPGGEPEPSEAEFRADFARLREALEPFFGEDAPEPEPEFDEADPLASLQRMEVIETFVRRHRRRADAMGLPTQDFLDQAARMRAKIGKLHEKAERATEALLQAQSNVADQRVVMIETIFQVAADLKANWPTMDAASRAHWQEVLDDYEEKRESLLADIPIADRRRLEEKYPC